jgi:hypothetical protein
MSIATSIVGTYRLPSCIAPGKEEFMHVGSDGRMVHFIYMDSAATRMVPMAFWAEFLGGDRYRTRLRPETESCLISTFVPTASGMRIERENIAFELTRVEDAELPEWYAGKLAKALERMSEREMQARQAEKDGDAGISESPA